LIFSSAETFQLVAHHCCDHVALHLWPNNSALLSFIMNILVSDIAIFVLKRDVKLQLTNLWTSLCVCNRPQTS